MNEFVIRSEIVNDDRDEAVKRRGDTIVARRDPPGDEDGGEL